MSEEPTVLDKLAEFLFGVRDTVNDAPSPVDYDLAKEFAVLNGIPADFPAADLPKAIAMWQRAQGLTVHRGGSGICKVPAPVNIDGVRFNYETTKARSLLAYLRGES